MTPYAKELLLQQAAVLFFVVGGFLAFLRFREWLDTLQFNKTMAPSEEQR